MKELPLEKQFAHWQFCQQVEALALDDAKKLLADLHLLYLNQQFLVGEMAKQDMLRGWNLN